jgi:adenylate cyclase
VEATARPHRRLIWKYTAVVVALVAAASVSVGLTELYFSYQDSKRALARAEQDKASTAAAAIEQTVQDLLRELEAVAQPTTDVGRAGLTQRNQDFHRLLSREKLVSELSYLDAAGKERVRTSPLELDRIDSGIDFSKRKAFVRARAEQRYVGDVYFQHGSQPHMTIAVAEAGRRGVVVAEIDLAFVGPIVERARIGTAGYAYAVDRRGELITHPDVDLVLGRTDFASLPQVQAALRATAEASADATTGRDPDGTEVLSAFQTIESLGWHVFVEEPLSEAFAPLEAAIWRTALLLVAFLVIATATSVLLARRLVRRRSARGHSISGSRSKATTSWGRLQRSSTAWQRSSRSRMRASRTRSRSAPVSSQLRSSNWIGRAASSRPRADTSRSSSRTCRTSSERP